VPPSAVKNAPRAKGLQPEGLDEMVRTGASLEHLDASQKLMLGNWIAARLKTPGQSGAGPWAWSLGRLGARVPIYGSGHKTISEDEARALGDTLPIGLEL
jgi:hypothetical protein